MNDNVREFDTIQISELRAICNRLFNALEKSGITKIELDQDYYWVIDETELYGIYQSPKLKKVGQLSDDLSEIRRLLSDSCESIPFHELSHLAPILQYVKSKVI